MFPKSSVCIYLIVSIVLLITGCFPKESGFKSQPLLNNSRDNSFSAIQESAVDSMLSSCTVYIDNQKPLIVASLVSIDDMKKSSTLGRMSSEIIAGRLAQQGFKVQEVKMSQSDIFVSEEEGEMILSRNLHQIGKKHDVQGFVVGTYAVGRYHRNRNEVDVYVALRLVDPHNIIVCSKNYTIPNTDVSLWK